MSSESVLESTPVTRRRRRSSATASVRRPRAEKPERTVPVLEPWLRSQSMNSVRHAAALRPFGRTEFGTDAAAPSDGHLQAANRMIIGLRSQLLALNKPLSQASEAARRDPSQKRVSRMLELKSRAHNWVRDIERVWDFYFELFGQRQTRFGDWLLSCDRIALDCYQAAFRGVGEAKSIPAPPPFSYMRTGFSPATYRRGIPLTRLGRLANPFPLIELPYHRMVNPWTLGAVLHEVSHNLQNDLGLENAVPRAIGASLLSGGHSSQVARTWVRWNRETFADLSGLLLGGPAIVASLMDVVGRSREATMHFGPGPHPTPYLRTLISVELLRRMGFPRQAQLYKDAWQRLYPKPAGGGIPEAMLRSFPDANRRVVDAIAFRRYPELGGRSLSEVYQFAPKDQQMIEEAARRLAAGNDPGVVPARFLIGATRVALDRRLARPGSLQRNFYTELSRR